MTSRPASAAWAGTIRSTAVLANTALAATAGHSASGTGARMCSRQHVGGVDGVLAGHDGQRAAPPGRLRSPAAITGATNLSTVGPTAVVTMSAAAISAITAGSSPRLLIAR